MHLFVSDAELDMFAEYYVSDGVLSGMRLNADFAWDFMIEGAFATIKESATTMLKCTDYGTTVIERPNVD